MKNQKGYKPSFLGKNLTVNHPVLSKWRKADVAPVKGNREGILHYEHHSVCLSQQRKLPMYTAVNIDASLFRSLKRDSLFPGGSDRWTIDQRAASAQWGDKLYSAPGSEFDKGHLVKREDPQWGKDEEEAIEAARSTFFFSNAVPQVGDLNRKEWRMLEDYILKKESAPNKLRVNVLTGPVLSDNDPVFVHQVNGQDVLIPGLFWKLVYFTNDGKLLSRVGFLMGQTQLLLKRGIATPGVLETAPPKLFEDYEDAATFQVNVSLIEELTGLTFTPAKEPFKDMRPSKVILKEVEISATRGAGKPATGDALGFVLDGLVL